MKKEKRTSLYDFLSVIFGFYIVTLQTRIEGRECVRKKKKTKNAFEIERKTLKFTCGVTKPIVVDCIHFCSMYISVSIRIHINIFIV